MEKISVRAPLKVDLKLAAEDLYTMRAAPPLVVTMAVVFLLTGNIVLTLISVGATSYISALWSRLLEPKAPGG